MHSGTAGQLGGFVDKHPQTLEELPLVHSTRCEKFTDIAKAHSLTPQPCSVFNEPLLYLFYGRPAYSSSLGGKPATSIAYCPICFVFKPYTLSKEIGRVFPFDSGASKNGLFEPYIARLDADRFQLSSTIQSARRAASLFFETNHKYFLGSPKAGVPIPPTETEVQAYYKLISHDGDEQYDDRRSAIELQVTAALNLQDTLLAIILPISFLQEPGIRKVVIEEWRTYPITYSTVKGTVPSQYVRVVANELEKYLKAGGYL